MIKKVISKSKLANGSVMLDESGIIDSTPIFNIEGTTLLDLIVERRIVYRFSDEKRLKAKKFLHSLKDLQNILNMDCEKLLNIISLKDFNYILINILNYHNDSSVRIEIDRIIGTANSNREIA